MVDLYLFYAVPCCLLHAAFNPGCTRKTVYTCCKDVARSHPQGEVAPGWARLGNYRPDTLGGSVLCYVTLYRMIVGNVGWFGDACVKRRILVEQERLVLLSFCSFILYVLFISASVTFLSFPPSHFSTVTVQSRAPEATAITNVRWTNTNWPPTSSYTKSRAWLQLLTADIATNVFVAICFWFSMKTKWKLHLWLCRPLLPAHIKLAITLPDTMAAGS